MQGKPRDMQVKGWKRNETFAGSTAIETGSLSLELVIVLPILLTVLLAIVQISSLFAGDAGHSSRGDGRRP